MNDDARRIPIPDEIRASWQALPEKEQRELERTWELAAEAAGADVDAGAVGDAERRLLLALAAHPAGSESKPGHGGAAGSASAGRGGAAGSASARRGRLAGRGSARMRRNLVVAATLLIGAVFTMLYLYTRPVIEHQPTTASHEYLLLLHGETLVRYPEEEHERIIGEYVAWARELGESGRFVAGDELAPGGRILSTQAGDIRTEPIEDVGAAISGYFIVSAANLDEAARIAAECPHLKYDGTVEIRQIGTH